MEPHEDQWAFLSSLPRITPREADGLARRVGAGTVGAAVTHLGVPTATKTVLHLHPTAFTNTGTREPSAPGGIADVYRELAADPARNEQIVADVLAALDRGRNCLVHTRCSTHLDRLEQLLRSHGRDPVVLRGGMGARARVAAMSRLQQPASLLVLATGSYIGEGIDCPPLDTVFLTAPVAFRGPLEQYVGRILRPRPGKRTAEVR